MFRSRIYLGTGPERNEMLHEKIAREIPQLARGQVWCRQCGSTQRTDSAEAMRSGWPKCCGMTMTIDSPDEQKRLAQKATNEQRSGESEGRRP